MIEIVKEQLDFGLITNRKSVIDFWQQEVGLVLDHVLPVGRGHDQYRFDVGGSVIKVNYLPDRDLAGAERSGYDELWIARDDVDAPMPMRDPDGNRLRLIPKGWEGVGQIAVRLRVPQLDRSLAYYRDVLGFEAIGTSDLQCGDSMLALVEDASAPTGLERPGRGWTYLTVQVRDCDAEVARIEERGARVAVRPRTLGKVARIAMVSDPDGNWLEISQRASLTGPLPGDDSRSAIEEDE